MEYSFEIGQKVKDTKSGMHMTITVVGLTDMCKCEFITVESKTEKAKEEKWFFNSQLEKI